MLVKDIGAVEVRQFDGKYLENRVPSGRPDIHEVIVPRFYIPPSALDQVLTASPNPIENAEPPLAITYKEYEERNRYLDRITGKDSISPASFPAIIVKKYRHGRPKPSTNQLDNQPLTDNGFDDRLPSYLQPSAYSVENRINYMHDGSFIQSRNTKNKQTSNQNKSHLNEELLSDPTYSQCLNIINEKEKAFLGAVGQADFYELRPDISQYVFPRVIVGLSARNNDFADLTSYRRRKNSPSHNAESNSNANAPDENAHEVDD